MFKDNFIHFHQISENFAFLIINLKIFSCILVSFKFCKFQSCNLKVTAKDKKKSVLQLPKPI